MDQDAIEALSDSALIGVLKTTEDIEIQALLESEMAQRGLGAHLMDGDGRVLFMYRTSPRDKAADEEE